MRATFRNRPNRRNYNFDVTATSVFNKKQLAKFVEDIDIWSAEMENTIRKECERLKKMRSIISNTDLVEEIAFLTQLLGDWDSGKS